MAPAETAYLSDKVIIWDQAYGRYPDGNDEYFCTLSMML